MHTHYSWKVFSRDRIMLTWGFLLLCLGIVWQLVQLGRLIAASVTRYSRSGVLNSQPVGRMRHALAMLTPISAKGKKNCDTSRDNNVLLRVWHPCSRCCRVTLFFYKCGHYFFQKNSSYNSTYCNIGQLWLYLANVVTLLLQCFIMWLSVKWSRKLISATIRLPDFF